MIRQGIRRLLRLTPRNPSRTASEMDDEIAYHLERRIEQLLARGLPRDVATAEARRRFGDAGARQRLIASASRRDTVLGLRERAETIAHDVRYAARRLRRAPAFALVAVITLALGIGANATVYTWMDGLVLHPLPLVSDLSRLVRVWTGTPSGETQSVSYPDYLDWASQSRTLRDVVAYRREQLSFRASQTADAVPVWAVLASSNYFEALGVAPIRGRSFRPEESAPQARAGGAAVAVLGYELWRRTFAGREDVVGATVWLNGHPLTIIGIAPPDFHGSNVGFAFDLWAPITMEPMLLAESPDKLTWRRARWMNVVARLAPGATIAQARSELRTIGARMAVLHVEDKDTRSVVTPFLQAEASGVLEPALLALLGATALVLAIVAFNLTGLQLVRALARRQELAVRLTLGAGRARIVQQFLIEATLLACLAVPAALAVAWWARGLLAHFLAHSTFPLAAPPPLGPRVLVFTAVATLVVALAVGVWPALRVSARARLEGSRVVAAEARITAEPRRGRAREALVVAQLALSLAGVASAGLLVRSLLHLRATDTGLIDPGRVLLVSSDFDLAGAGYAGFGDDPLVRARRLPLAMELLRQARALPGVRGAALADAAPLGLVNGFDSFDIDIRGYVPKPNETMSSEIAYVTPEYFTVVGPRLARGRGFVDGDRANMPSVLVINAAFARRYWSGSDPASAALGKSIYLGGRNATIVGIVGDAKFHWVSEAPRPFIYLPYAQWSPSSLTLAVRLEGDPAAMVGSIRRIFHDVDPALPVLDPRTLADQVDGALTLQRLGAALVASLAALALAIAGLGLYAALMQAVQQRHREIGIRMALGAQPTDVLQQFTRRGLGVAAVGVALGIPMALAAGRLLRGQIYGIGPADPLSLAATATIFLVVVIAASFVTALRAARVDPALSIRAE